MAWMVSERTFKWEMLRLIYVLAPFVDTLGIWVRQRIMTSSQEVRRARYLSTFAFHIRPSEVAYLG